MSLNIDPVKVRTIFISDIHLGMKGCQAELLIDFLRRHEADTIFLVGDIVDGWRMKASRSWPKLHLDVAAELLAKARTGARIIYIPGNHDGFLREFVGSSVGGIEIATYAIHEGTDGQRYFVTHGDQCDLVIQRARWLAFLGHWSYHALLALDTYLSTAQHGLGLSNWSLSAWVRSRVKKAEIHMGRFEEKLSAEARRHNAQGVICGHIHHAADHNVFGVRYINTGDWVESCTGVLEHHDGRFEIVRWRHATAASRIGSLIAPADFPINGRQSHAHPAKEAYRGEDLP